MTSMLTLHKLQYESFSNATNPLIYSFYISQKTAFSNFLKVEKLIE